VPILRPATLPLDRIVEPHQRVESAPIVSRSTPRTLTELFDVADQPDAAPRPVT
jgi:hypothetical protein